MTRWLNDNVLPLLVGVAWLATSFVYLGVQMGAQ